MGQDDSLVAELRQSPSLAALHALWQSKRAGRAVPARRDFDTLELWPWLGHLLLVETTAGGGYRYRVYGTTLAELFGRELTGKAVTPSPSPAHPLVAADYDRARQRAAPLLLQRIAAPRGRPVRLQMLLLPLASDGGAADMVLAAVYAQALPGQRPRFSSLPLF